MYSWGCQAGRNPSLWGSERWITQYGHDAYFRKGMSDKSAYPASWEEYHAIDWRAVVKEDAAI
jgi:hypothetical protein